MSLPRGGPLPNLTSLRFFAAMYVLLFHLIGGRWFGAGYTGVSLFFILSGFILAYNFANGVKPGRFYVARVARIYPLYLFAFFLAFPLFVHTDGLRSAWKAIPFLLMLQT